MKRDYQEYRMIDVRAVTNEEKEMIIEGYAIVYDTPATHTFGEYTFTEVIRKGALDFTDMKDVPLRYNHNDTWCIMARTRNKSLRLIKDDIGLKIEAVLIDTQSNRDVYRAIEAKLIDKMSFAFEVAKDGDIWKFNDNDTFREITNIKKLYDVSVVDTPFYDSTSISARSVEMLDSEINRRRLESLDFRKRKILLTHRGNTVIFK